MILIHLFLLGLCMVGPAMTVFAATLEETDLPELTKVVYLERHGVRSPTQKITTLQEWTAHPWPTWPVSEGELTPRGAELVQSFWKEESAQLRKQGLLPLQGCPSPHDILVLADLDQRTQATAQAVLEGLAPQCGLVYMTDDVSTPDPLFHPVKAKLCTFNVSALAQQLSPKDLAAHQATLAPLLNELGALLGPADPAWCLRFNHTKDCLAPPVPSRIVVSDPAYEVSLQGGLAVSSASVEIMLLEYAQWEQNAAWSQVDEQTLQKLLPIHAQTFDLLNRTPEVATCKASALLADMEKTLMGTHPYQAFNKAKIVIYVGHDTNIATIGGLLGLNWKLPGYPANGIPPGSALALHRWDTVKGSYIDARYLAQSLHTLHSQKGGSPMLSQKLYWKTPAGFKHTWDLRQWQTEVQQRLRTSCIPEHRSPIRTNHIPNSP